MADLIEVQGLCKDYGDFCLDHVDLKLPGGTILGLIGENGAGKTTTLKAILGLIRPDGGTVKVLGRTVDWSDPACREDIGVVLDECAFHDPLKAPQVGRILAGTYRNWDAPLFDAYLDRFGLPRNKKIKEFSKGMKMKLSIASALAHHPRLLVLDEATSGLDPVVRSELLDEFPLGIFSTVKGNPPDAMDDPDQTRTYSITVSTRYGEARTIAGSFDRDGLPRDWAEFVDYVLTFISMYEGYELFNPCLYGRRKRRRSDYIYCSVSFEEGGQTYSYLARDDSYAVGDRVVVPAGRENREALAQIESISYYAAGEAPFPVERTKYILRKYEDDTDHDK